MSTGTFDFNLFLQESKETLLNPKSYFTSLKTDGGIADPLIKAVVYGTLTGVIYLLWDLLNFGSAVGPFFSGVFGFYGFIKVVLGSVIGLFIGAVVTLIISSICKGNTDYEANLRVTSAAMVIMPIYALLGIALWISYYLGALVSIAIYAYSMWILYHGLVFALKCEEKTARTVCYIIAGVIGLFSLIGMFSVSRIVP